MDGSSRGWGYAPSTAARRRARGRRCVWVLHACVCVCAGGVCGCVATGPIRPPLWGRMVERGPHSSLPSAGTNLGRRRGVPLRHRASGLGRAGTARRREVGAADDGGWANGRGGDQTPPTHPASHDGGPPWLAFSADCCAGRVGLGRTCRPAKGAARGPEKLSAVWAILLAEGALDVCAGGVCVCGRAPETRAGLTLHGRGRAGATGGTQARGHVLQRRQRSGRGRENSGGGKGRKGGPPRFLVKARCVPLEPFYPVDPDQNTQAQAERQVRCLSQTFPAWRASAAGQQHAQSHTQQLDNAPTPIRSESE